MDKNEPRANPTLINHVIIVYELRVGTHRSTLSLKHWTKPMVNHDVRLSNVMIHQATILHRLSTLRECWSCAKINRRLYGWDPKVVIYPYGLGHCWWRLVATRIFNKGTMISHEIEIVCLFWFKGHVIMKSIATLIHLVEFDMCSLEMENVSWSHNKWDL